MFYVEDKTCSDRVTGNEQHSLLTWPFRLTSVPAWSSFLTIKTSPPNTASCKLLLPYWENKNRLFRKKIIININIYIIIVIIILIIISIIIIIIIIIIFITCFTFYLFYQLAGKCLINEDIYRHYS